jgi:hypothetical protein
VLEYATLLLDFGESLEPARNFGRVESDYYPQLGAYYDARLESLPAEDAAENAQDEDEDAA